MNAEKLLKEINSEYLASLFCKLISQGLKHELKLNFPAGQIVFIPRRENVPNEDWYIKFRACIERLSYIDRDCISIRDAERYDSAIINCVYALNNEIGVEDKQLIYALSLSIISKLEEEKK